MKSDLTQNPKVSPTEGLAKLSSYRNNPISSDYPMERGAIGSFGSRQTAALRICSEQREMGGASDLSTRAQGASGASPPPSPARDSIRSGPRPRRPTPGAQGPVPAASAPAGTRHPQAPDLSESESESEVSKESGVRASAAAPAPVTQLPAGGGSGPSRGAGFPPTPALSPASGGCSPAGGASAAVAASGDPSSDWSSGGGGGGAGTGTELGDGPA